jgi:NTP pyrophosphatase (non-canonical NTP hydrolase)
MSEARTSDPVVCERLIIRDALSLVSFELHQAMQNWPPFNSAHEGYAVLAEEVDELWSHVKTNQKRRDLRAMRKEALQVAAMALRFAIEVCNDEAGRK